MKGCMNGNIRYIRKKWARKNKSPLEIRPSFRMVKMLERPKYGDEITTKLYYLAFPYMQFFLYADEPSVTWSMESVSSFDDLVSIPLLPNIWEGGKICLGFDAVLTTSIDVCNFFWSSVFSSFEFTAYPERTGPILKSIDSPCLNNLENSKLKSYKHWQKLSKKAKTPMEVFEGFSSPQIPFDYFFKPLNIIELWEHVVC